MRILEPDVVSLSELQELAALARNRICRLYLHWMQGAMVSFMTITTLILTPMVMFTVLAVL